MKPTFIQQDPSIERRRRLALAMMQGGETGPVRTGMEGLGRVAKMLAGAYGVRKAGQAEEKYNTDARTDLEKIMADMGSDVRPLSQHPGTQDIAMQIQMQQMEGDRAAGAAETSRRQGLEDYDTRKAIDQHYAKPPKGTSQMQNAAALGLVPGTPEYNNYLRDATKKGPLVKLGDESTPLQKELAKKNATSFAEWRDQAIAAGKMEPYLNVMEQIAADFETGKPEKALASMGQWLGTDSGTALQAWKAAQVPIMLQMAESVSGPMTEKEWDMLREALPNFGTNPQANKIVLRLIRKGIDGSRENFSGAQEHMKTNNNTLQGYMPSYAKRADQSGDWIIMEDAAGNKAYVNSKTNEVKEL